MGAAPALVWACAVCAADWPTHWCSTAVAIPMIRPNTMTAITTVRPRRAGAWFSGGLMGFRVPPGVGTATPIRRSFRDRDTRFGAEIEQH